jgi:hypothetical protein
LNLSTFTARFVLSMNCKHHNANRRFDNELICTACSPAGAGEQPVSNAQRPIKTMFRDFAPDGLFTAFGPKDLPCEKVSLSELQPGGASTKKAALGDGLFNPAGSLRQDAFGAAAGFALAAAFLRLR